MPYRRRLYDSECPLSPRWSRHPLTPPSPPVAAAKKKPSYLEAREYESIELRVHEAEQILEQKRAALKDPSLARDGRLIEQAYREVEEAQAAVDAIYARWAELEQKMA